MKYGRAFMQFLNIDPRTKPPPTDWEAQMQIMHYRLNQWREQNLMRSAHVRFRMPRKGDVILGIDQALNHGFVQTDDAGMELLKFMWPDWSDPCIPTFHMYRFFFEYDLTKLE